jgi:hypothetical protein
MTTNINANEKFYQKVMNALEAGETVSPLKAIRAKCLDCCCYQIAEVRYCPVECPLKPYRMGKNTTRVRRRAEEDSNILTP